MSREERPLVNLAGIAFLRAMGHPDDLERLADTLETMARREDESMVGGCMMKAQVADVCSWLRSSAGLARPVLEALEAWGVCFDPEKREFTIPTGTPGRPRKVETELVLAVAQEYTGAGYRDPYGGDRLQAIREYLTWILPSEALTDERLVSILQRHAPPKRSPRS